MHDKLKIGKHKNPDFRGFSSDIQNQLNEINDCEIKKNKLLLEKVKDYEVENKMLKETNKKANIYHDALKTSIKTVQVDVNNCKENYKKLRKENKKLLAKLLRTKKVIKNSNADSSEELPRKRRKITKTYTNNTNSSINKYIADRGLILILYDRIMFQIIMG